MASAEHEWHHEVGVKAIVNLALRKMQMYCGCASSGMLALNDSHYMLYLELFVDICSLQAFQTYETLIHWWYPCLTGEKIFKNPMNWLHTPAMSPGSAFIICEILIEVIHRYAGIKCHCFIVRVWCAQVLGLQPHIHQSMFTALVIESFYWLYSNLIIPCLPVSAPVLTWI